MPLRDRAFRSVGVIDKWVHNSYQAEDAYFRGGGNVSWSPSHASIKLPLSGARVMSKERELKYGKCAPICVREHATMISEGTLRNSPFW